MSTTRAYGCWPSPISAEHVAAAGRKFADLKTDPAAAAGPSLYWLESRPDEAGRNTVMCAPVSARSAVHEYGGGAFTVHADTLWFVDGADQAIWRRDPDGSLARMTTGAGERFADLQYDAAREWLFAVVETPRADNEPRATLETIDAAGDRQVVAEGHDFYASPRLSPAGDRLVWLAWNHPDMPWDATELWQADIGADGVIGAPVCRWAPNKASLFGPLFAPDGRLYIVCDADNWWNIYGEIDAGEIKAGETGTGVDFAQLTHERAEFGVPQWVFGQSSGTFTDDGRLYAIATRDGIWQLGEVDTGSGRFTPLALDADFFEYLHALGHELVVVAANAATPKQIVAVREAGATRTLRASAGLPTTAVLAQPESICWPSDAGDTAHGLLYAPASADYTGPAHERPPLIIKCHGGPTGATHTALDARIQYWTSRGYAVLDVNYRGSTGYGRAYRQKLIGAWGVADVADCVHGARYLAGRDAIDADRILISGSSAGGYTVLCVLTFTELAAAGASYYGIGDLARLLAATHKFESRYLQRLIGADDTLLRARSPLVHAERLSRPVLFLQGLKDKVVPPEQAEAMVAALRAANVPVAYVTFAEERHGFRDAANIARAIEAERSFYSRVLGMVDAGELAPLTIENAGADI